MPFYENAIRDERVREYLPVKRILWSDHVENKELLLERQELQPVINGLSKTVIRRGGSILLDFGIELHGGVHIASFRAGTCRLTFGESASEAMQIPNQDHAVHQLETPLPLIGICEYGNTAFRFLRIDNIGTADLPLFGISAVALFRDLEFTGSFTSSDERLNRIWKTARHTVHLNMQDYLYDGAKRDRLVWIGDMHPEVRGILAAFSDHSVIRKSFDFLKRITPSGEAINGIYSYNCWYVISLHDFYMATGDIDFIRSHADFFEPMLRQFAGFIDADNREALPGRRFLDWPNNDNPEAIHAGLHGLLRWMLVSGAGLLRAIEHDAAFAENAAARLLKHVPECPNRKAPAALLTLNGISDCSRILADDPFHGVSTFFGFYVLLAKPTVSALELIRKYWGAMLDRGATTFWEDFDLDWLEGSGRIDELPEPGFKDLHADYGAYCYKGLRHSLCHGWSCGPLPFLSERISGIRFLEAGGKKVVIQPDLGDLEYAKVERPTPHGKIVVELNRGAVPKIQLPDGVELVGR